MVAYSVETKNEILNQRVAHSITILENWDYCHAFATEGSLIRCTLLPTGKPVRIAASPVLCIDIRSNFSIIFKPVTVYGHALEYEIMAAMSNLRPGALS